MTNHPRAIRLAPAAAALLLVAACSSSHRAAVPPTSSSTSTSPGNTSTSSAATPAPGPSTTVAPSSPPASAGGPLPAGFAVTDLTWVSDSEGWALGTAPCGHGPCTSIAHTLDGGRSWAGLPAPIAYLDRQAPAGCSASVACVHGIRFATSSIGYVFGSSSLWLTTDGGHTWSKGADDATAALETDHGVVVRATPGSCSPPGCPYALQQSVVGSAIWTPVAAPPLSGDGAWLALDGGNWNVAVFENPAGGAGDAHAEFAGSTDGGRHWSAYADPCGVTAGGDEADASGISAAPGGYLAVACTARQAGQAGFVVVSADGGATFGPHRGGLLSAVPANGESVGPVAAATGQRLATWVSDRNGTQRIVVSNDSGADWTVTHSESGAAGGLAASFLGFEDAQTGRAVPDARTVLTTTDGGGHWTAFTFP